MKALKWVAAIILLAVISGLLLFVAFGFGPKHRQTYEQSAPEFIPESVRNLPVQDIGEIDGDLFSARLQEATLIDGFLCAAGAVVLTKSGQLHECTLVDGSVINIPQNTRVEYYEETDSYLYFFPENTEIQGFQILSKARRLGGSLEIPSSFYPSGRLRAFYSTSNVIIQGISCRKANFGLLASTPLRAETTIVLHENGNLRRCTLSIDTEINGLNISAGSEIRISEDGDVTIVDDSFKRRTTLWITGFFD